MTAPNFSDDWLTFPLTREPEGVDGPFLPGHKVRIREFIGPYVDDKYTRRWFTVYIDDDKRVVVKRTLGSATRFICSDHEVPGSCKCRDALRKYLESE
jgi:hypothetical protein